MNYILQSVALQVDGEIKIGLIYDPIKNEVFMPKKIMGSSSKSIKNQI